MGGIKKSIKKALGKDRLKSLTKVTLGLGSPKELGRETKSIVSGTGDDMETLFNPNGEAMEELAKQQAEANKARPMPDDYELERARRRRGASSGGGRASTIMSSGSTDRLGG